jgi:hypothetical protein
MTTHATGTLQNKTWDEAPFSELDGAGKLTHSLQTDAFDGDIQGEGTVKYLMAYSADPNGPATFVGLRRVVGRLGARSGSFVLQESGTYANNAATATWFVLRGSGTGALTGVHGEGGYTWDGSTQQYSLDYDIE